MIKISFYNSFTCCRVNPRHAFAEFLKATLKATTLHPFNIFLKIIGNKFDLISIELKNKRTTMKQRLFPVILTAAITSAATFFAVAHFQQRIPYFTEPARQAPVNYTAYTGNNGTAMSSGVNFEAAAAASVKAVVHVKTTTKARTVVDNTNDVYTQLFGRRQYYIPSQVESGSGVVISPDGYIVTNNHVVANGDEVAVTFNDRYTTKAKVVAKDPSTDIAILKVDGENNLPYMEMGNSDDVKLGQWVLAVGYPLSLEATVTAGIVSAKGRSIGINRTQSENAIESFIQTDAAVNPGNSGGALVNTAGQLIGINSAIASPTGSYAGYSYAIPVNIVRKVANDLMKFGTVQRAYMGIEYVDNKTATPEQMKALGLDRTEGIYVKNVLPNSGAANAGIKQGDIITQVNNQVVSNQPQLQEQIARYTPGDNVNVTFLRDGKPMTTVVKLNKIAIPANVLGAAFRPLNSQEMQSYGVDGGLVVTDPGKGALARKTQIRKGFVITSINDETITSVAELEQIVSNSKVLQIAGFQPGYLGRYYYTLDNSDAVIDKQ